MRYVNHFDLSISDLDTYRAQPDVTKTTVFELSDWQKEQIEFHEEKELCFIDDHKCDRVIALNRLGYVCFRESPSGPITHLVNTDSVEVYEEVF